MFVETPSQGLTLTLFSHPTARLNIFGLETTKHFRYFYRNAKFRVSFGQSILQTKDSKNMSLNLVYNNFVFHLEKILKLTLNLRIRNTMMNHILCAPRVHQDCTRSAPGLHQECTRRAPGLHRDGTRSAPGLHQECTRIAPGWHQE